MSYERATEFHRFLLLKYGVGNHIGYNQIKAEYMSFSGKTVDGEFADIMFFMTTSNILKLVSISGDFETVLYEIIL